MSQERTYRNVFAEIGHTEEEISRRLQEVDQIFFLDEEERIYHEAGEDMGYLTDTGNDDARTEGMSYGIMMCVQLDRKERFDRIWKWAKTYMFMVEVAEREKKPPEVGAPSKRPSMGVDD
ncbi:MAG: hypothetical protein IJT34_10485 [Butyrivibrio sp.]|nr:hypothetical protein [Butyrivibrio sp.]